MVNVPTFTPRADSWCNINSRNASLESPLEVLQHIFGFSAFRAEQEAIIAGLIDGDDQFVLMPTGGGKSLCYQIPALIRKGVGIVVSPLISLMLDQVNALQQNGVSAAFYNSSLSSAEASKVLALLHNDELDLLYVAPERLLSDNFLSRLSEIEISLFAIDEAHCISGWGHDFRPEYVQLRKLRDYFPGVPMIALTATADNPTRADIIHHLKLDRAKKHIASFNRPNIRYTVLEKNNPKTQLQKIISQKNNEAGIIYCATRKHVEDVAKRLQSISIEAFPYHAGLSSQIRQTTQDKFQKDEIQIVVATVAFGMGIDKSNVRFVIHYDIPKNIEGYYQETGRAGRDGVDAEAILLYGISDIAKVRGMIEMSSNENQKRIEAHKFNAMIGFAEAQTCRRRVLLQYFEEVLDKDCGNCDVCLNPPEQFDATKAAQKFLSCMYRAQQRFGMKHIIDILRGADTQKIKQFNHNNLTTYGIGSEYSGPQWSNIARQLIHLGYINQDIANYSVLKLTDKSRELLRGEVSITLAKPRVIVEKKAKKSTKKKARDELTEEVDQALFEQLRVLRKSLSTAAGVPPFVIFSDASLIEMAIMKPSDTVSFLAINGVGASKLEKYGEQFIAEINTV